MDPASESYYRHLCEHLGFSCIGIDRALRIVFLNVEATRHLSYRGIAAGGLILDLFDVPDRPAVQKLFENTIQTGTTGELEVKLAHGDEESKTFILIASPIADASGRAEGVSLSMRDISMRKQLSQELARARRMGSLGKMAGAVAHHFNNILGGMLTSIDLAMHSESVRDIRNTLRLLAQSITRATRITNQLAAFAASENAREEFSELSTIMAAFQARLKRMPKPAGTEIVTHFGAVEPAQFESGRLLSVLESIAHNGIDAMQTGGVLTIDLRQDGDKAVIAITDTGCGMSKEMMDNLFEPFFTTKGELGGGTTDNIGLSMAAVHGLVTEMGGTISVTSKLGNGTRVTIRVPLRRDSSEPEPASTPTPV